MKRTLLVALGATLMALGVIGIASAHATLDHCTPAIGSTAATAPAQIVCIYSEEIDTKRSTMGVWDANGNEVDKKDAHVDLNDPDHKSLIVSLDPALESDGLYTVKWHAVTPDDNGVSDGSWQFIIGSANATPYPPTVVVQGETPAAGTPTAPTAAASQVASATSITTAAPAATTTPAATATSPTPSTAPTTGGATTSALVILALLGIVLLLGGVMIRVKR
jgi:methionine-rich copper-binding protein CopC